MAQTPQAGCSANLQVGIRVESMIRIEKQQAIQQMPA
jgi:hypothetical protein